MAPTVVLEEQIAASNRRHEQILVAVVIDVSERCGDADTPLNGDAGFRGDVSKPPAAEILPELVPTDLIHEVDVVEPVAIDVGNGDPVAVVIVNSFVVLAGVLDDVV